MIAAVARGLPRRAMAAGQSSPDGSGRKCSFRSQGGQGRQ
jgi:hypothetical protein